MSAALICEAIRALRLLEFTYEGNRRLVAPYCHGVSGAGHPVLRAIQVGGASTSRAHGSGKLWRLDKMTDVNLLETAFVPDDPHYNPDDSAMHEIHCRVARRAA